MSKNSLYFRHDYNARNDERLLGLRAEFGYEGVGIYWALVESMAESTDGFLNGGAMGGLSVGLGIEKKKLTDIVEFCKKLGLFYEKEDLFSSKRILAHKNEIEIQRESGKKGAKARWGDGRVKVKRKKEFDTDEWERMVDFFGECVKCEGESNLKYVERDHIVLLSKGGVDTPENWQPLCAKCNTSKGLDMKDYRISYCKKKGLDMPEKWLPHGGPIQSPMQRREDKTINTNGDTELFNNNGPDMFRAKAQTPSQYCQKFFQQDPEAMKAEAEFFAAKGVPMELIKQEFAKFSNYWLELTPGGKKHRWQIEKTFEVRLRLVTWFRNAIERAQKKGGSLTMPDFRS